MNPGIVLALLLATTTLPNPLSVESARYRFLGSSPWRAVHAIENPGYRIALSARDGVVLEARVEVHNRPLRDDVPFPPALDSIPVEIRALLRASRPSDPETEALARLLTRGAETELEAVERVISYTSRRIRYELPDGRVESAASCRRSGRGSCVGRSLLAEDLLVRSGIPTRQVTGILTARAAGELSTESRAAFNMELGGVRHRWIEVYVPRLGWVPSDPGGLANSVTARHIALAEPPMADLSVQTLSRSSELAWPPLSGPGKGLTLARPRGDAGR